MRVRLSKIANDLRSDFAKNALMIAAIAVGVLSVGTILGAYTVLSREMTRNYLETKPAHATIKVDRELTPQLVDEVRRIDGVSAAERHGTVTARMKIGSDWKPILLFVIDDFRDMRTNRCSRESGAWPPPEGTMLIERTARLTTKSDIGGNVLVKTPHGATHLVRVSGIVHDPGLAPAWQEQEGYGYVTAATLRGLGETTAFDELRIRLANDDVSASEVEAVARKVAALVERRGVRVHEIQIPPPRRHPHESQMRAIMTLFLIFSFATLILSATLVATSLATTMTRQLREIGVMKAIGARSSQIAALYLATQAVVAGIATAIGLAASRYTAALMIGKISSLLNLQISDGSIPLRVSLVQALAGVALPMAATAIPIWRSSRISVRESLTSYGVSSAEESRPAAALSKLRLFGTSGALAVRNVFRQRGRLAMSLALLAAGGSLFMTALNVSAAWDANLRKIYRFRHYDLELRLASEVDAEEALDRIERVAGVRRAESWPMAPTSFTRDAAYDIANVYPDKGHGSFTLLGVPQDTRLVDFPLLDGRWLRANDVDGVVLNHSARAKAPQLNVGDRTRLSVEGRVTEWRVVGFVEDLGSTGATAYVNQPALARALGTDPHKTNMVRVALEDRSVASALRKTREIEAALGADMPVSMTLPLSLIRTAIGEHMAVLVSALLALAVLMAIVGGFGLGATTSMNVLERTREIGVMRAIGATPRVVASTIITEGFAIAAMSLLFAMVGSIALSYGMSQLLGNMAFRTPLPLTVSVVGVGGWVAILALGSALATAIPARRAMTMTVRDALAYS